MSKALYRKYRSRSLDEIVGQPQVTTPLKQAIKDGKISHAYLFIGPRGTGKTSVARILAHAVNDFDYELEDNYLDIVEIDAASNTGVDNIRDLREKALIAPSKGKYKVYIIDEIHMLSKPAFNALLKILEEPPAHVIFIMATTDAHKVPITITSRSQVFTFKLAENSVMQSHLREIADKENIKITDDALSVVVRLGGGSFRDSLSLLDQISTLASDEITKDAVISALGLPQDEILTKLLTNYTTCDIIDTIDTLKSLLSTGIRPETVAEELIKRIIDAPTPATITLLQGLIDVSRPDFPIAKLILTFANSSSTNLSLTPSPAHVSTPAPTSTSSPTLSPIPNPMSTPPPTSAPSQTQTQAQSPQTPKSSSPHPNPLKPYLKPNFTHAKPQTPPSLAREHLQPTLQAPVTAENFDWNTLLTNLSTASLSVSSQLRSASYQISNNTLTIYPATNISKKILESPNNKNLIIKYIGSLNLTISAPNPTIQTPTPTQPQVPTGSQNQTPPQPQASIQLEPTQAQEQAQEQSQPQSPTPSPLSQLSAIMGTVKEVKIDDGDIPV